MKAAGKAFIISAPSGAGKTSLVAAVLNEIDPAYNLYRMVTFTTKKPRLGEEPGKDYHYVTHEEFQCKVAEGFFLEITDALGHFYGTPRSLLDDLSQGRSPILIIDRVGAQQLVQKVPNPVLIWIAVPTIEIVRQRLAFRNTENEAQLEKRLCRAAQEMAEEEQSRFYTHHLMNDMFDDAVKNLKQLIINELS